MKRLSTILPVLLVAGCLLSCHNSQQVITFPEPPRAKGVTDVLELRCEPLDTVRVAFIGLGMRGSGAVHRYTFLEGVKVVALCDVVPENIERANKTLEERGFPKAEAYTGPEDWKKICERPDVDLVYVCTHWDLHAP
ncbi:MAG TPA: acetylgalactosaminidase, partial [Bacteroidales bacterium]|nr:acetylgalactosaminidase [Bacteroidales bacterium]